MAAVWTCLNGHKNDLPSPPDFRREMICWVCLFEQKGDKEKGWVLR